MSLKIYNQCNSGHQNSLEVGVRFQDFICMELFKSMGFVIQNFGSKHFQYEFGENLQGIEIKYDARSTGDCTVRQCLPTGKVGIEVAEKSTEEISNWTDSGIMRKDNSWLYIVGNYHQAWIFPKNILVLLYESGRYEVRETRPTLRTILMPVEHADKYCAKKIVFNTVQIGNNEMQ